MWQAGQGDRRSWPINDPGAKLFGRFSQRKKKGPKKKESLSKLPQLWKSIKVAFGDFLLMISHKPLEKASHRTLRLFHSSDRLGYYEPPSAFGRGN
jgi:hypothetical protein